MELLNLCPHPVVVFGNGDVKIYDLPEAENPARTIYEDKFVGDCIKRKTVRAVENLPAPKPGTVYVVSNIVRSALPARLDLASPSGTEIRGTIRGCRYLIIN